MIEYMTLEQMRNQIGRMISDVLSGGTVDSTSRRGVAIDEWINSSYSDCANRYRWPQLLRGSESTLTVTSGQRYLYLTDKYVDQIYFLFPGAMEVLAPVQGMRDLFARYQASFDVSGNVQNWADAGEFGIKAAFSTTAETITVVSDSASDTAVDVLVRGLSSGGTDEVQEAITLNGTSSVVGSTTFSEVTSVSTDGTAVGVITVTGSTSATEYATIAPGERTARYKRLRLAFVPGTAETYTVYWKKRVARLTNDDQVPEIPIGNAIISFCVAAQYAQQRKWQAAAAYHRAAAEQRLIDAWEASSLSGAHFEQSMPLNRSHYISSDQLIVVRNT